MPRNGSYSYNITLPAGEEYVFINLIDIIDDMDVEDNETFYIRVEAGPDGPTAGYAVALESMIARVTIIDNDEEDSELCIYAMYFNQKCCMILSCSSNTFIFTFRFTFPFAKNHHGWRPPL